MLNILITVKEQKNYRAKIRKKNIWYLCRYSFAFGMDNSLWFCIKILVHSNIKIVFLACVKNVQFRFVLILCFSFFILLLFLCFTFRFRFSCIKVITV